MSEAADISVIVNAHREGLIAVATLKSLHRAKIYAESRGHKVEIIICLDKCDALTRETIKDFEVMPSKVLEVDFGDLGLSRNYAVQKSCGRYIAFLDADDLFSQNWLENALRCAILDKRDIVWHPEFNLYFGTQPHIFRHIDMEAEEFDPLLLAASNPWTALCFASRSVFEKFPYPKTDLAQGVGYEDWGWNRLTIDAGYLHKTVVGTSHAIRRKAVSLVKQTSAAGVFPAKTDLFRTMLANRAKAKAVRQAVQSPQ